MYYYLYRTINTINDKIYVGVHQTNNLEDGYVGSGKNLKRAIKKYGLENFKKEILEFFDTSEDMYAAEAQTVNEDFIARKDTYNIKCGGRGGFDHLRGTTTVKDVKTGEYLRVALDDPRLKTGELNVWNFFKGKRVVRSLKTGETLVLELDDPRLETGEYVSLTIGKIVVKTKSGETFSASVDDPRLETGEIVPYWTGLTHSEETKRKIGEKSAIHQQGEKNSQYGTMWICNIHLKENTRISKNDPIPVGWIKGRNKWNSLK